MAEPDRCSFCARLREEVRLISGPDVAICEWCVETSRSLFTQLSSGQPPRIGQRAALVQEETEDAPSSQAATRRRDAVARYLEQLRGSLPLRQSERTALLERARQGDDDARRTLVESHLELAALLALSLAPQELDPLDAIQEANLALDALVRDNRVPDPTLALTSAVGAALTRTDHS